jgi:hypothetical protein
VEHERRLEPTVGDQNVARHATSLSGSRAAVLRDVTAEPRPCGSSRRSRVAGEKHRAPPTAGERRRVGRSGG